MQATGIDVIVAREGEKVASIDNGKFFEVLECHFLRYDARFFKSFFPERIFFNIADDASKPGESE